MENQTIKLERFKQAVFEDAEKQAKLITEAADKQRENELAQAKIEAQSLADSKKAAADKTEENWNGYCVIIPKRIKIA